MFIWFKGSFTLDEANEFVLATLDDVTRSIAPHYGEFFEDLSLRVKTQGFTIAGTPIPMLQYYIDMYSLVEYTPRYFFDLARHQIDHYIRQLRLKKKTQKPRNATYPIGSNCNKRR